MLPSYRRSLSTANNGGSGGGGGQKSALLNLAMFAVAGTFGYGAVTLFNSRTSDDSSTKPAAPSAPITSRVYFDIAIQNKPTGRIVIGLYGFLLEGVADRDWGIAFSVVNGRINKQKLFSDLLLRYYIISSVYDCHKPEALLSLLLLVATSRILYLASRRKTASSTAPLSFIWDTGASVHLTPFCGDFIAYPR